MTSPMDIRAHLQKDFEAAERGGRPSARTKPSPFSIRLSDVERARPQSIR